LVQKEQVQARAGISAGSGSQARKKEMFPQWHLPWINMRAWKESSLSIVHIGIDLAK
jgi:hypothetical protein